MLCSGLYIAGGCHYQSEFTEYYVYFEGMISNPSIFADW